MLYCMFLPLLEVTIAVRFARIGGTGKLVAIDTQPSGMHDVCVLRTLHLRHLVEGGGRVLPGMVMRSGEDACAREPTTSLNN